MSAPLRSIVAVAVPLLLTLGAVIAVDKVIKEPAFVQFWSNEAKAFGLFAVTLIGLAGLTLVSVVLAHLIDPDGVGRDKRAFARLIDDAAMHASLAAVVSMAAYVKEIGMWPFLTAIAFFGLLSVLQARRNYRQAKALEK